jgi:hypothetical protein
MLIVTMFAVAFLFSLAGQALATGHRFLASFLGLCGWVGFLLHNTLLRRREQQL